MRLITINRLTALIIMVYLLFYEMYCLRIFENCFVKTLQEPSFCYIILKLEYNSSVEHLSLFYFNKEKNIYLA